MRNGQSSCSHSLRQAAQFDKNFRCAMLRAVRSLVVTRHIRTSRLDGSNIRSACDAFKRVNAMDLSMSDWKSLAICRRIRQSPTKCSDRTFLRLASPDAYLVHPQSPLSQEERMSRHIVSMQKCVVGMAGYGAGSRNGHPAANTSPADAVVVFTRTPLRALAQSLIFFIVLATAACAIREELPMRNPRTGSTTQLLFALHLHQDWMGATSDRVAIHSGGSTARL
jgi:hypothetical protein